MGTLCDSCADDGRGVWFDWQPGAGRTAHRRRQGPTGTNNSTRALDAACPRITPRAGRRLYLGGGTTSKPQGRCDAILRSGRTKPAAARERHMAMRVSAQRAAGTAPLLLLKDGKRRLKGKGSRELHNPRPLSTLFHLHSTDDRPATADRHPPATRRPS